jgi:hypothetical protein
VTLTSINNGLRVGSKYRNYNPHLERGLPMRAPMAVLALSFIVSAVACVPQAQEGRREQGSAQPEASTSAAISLATPAALREEHRDIHTVLEGAAAEPAELGAAAQELAGLLAPHFRREEEIATPPLSLLVPLSQGPVTVEMRAVLPMTEALEREMPQMLAEHARIRDALGRFEAAARVANREEYVRFSEALAHHARQEEEIFYPAAIVVGRFVAAGDARR